jgi:hypothetical protein
MRLAMWAPEFPFFLCHRHGERTLGSGLEFFDFIVTGPLIDRLATARSGRCPLPILRRYNDRAARVVKLVDTVDLKSTDAETRRAGSSPALGTRDPVMTRFREAGEHQRIPFRLIPRPALISAMRSFDALRLPTSTVLEEILVVKPERKQLSQDILRKALAMASVVDKQAIQV